MGRFKALADRLKDKRDELTKAAAEKAAKRAAKAAFEGGAKAARGALDAAGKAIQSALFGSDADEKGAKGEDPPESAAPGPAPEKPDPFAKLKAAEAARDAARKASDEKAVKLEQEVDAELAAMKKRLGKP